MRAIISCTSDPLYSYYLPISAFCWNKLGVKVVAFTPDVVSKATFFAMQTMNFEHKNENLSFGFIARDDKRPTYSQLSRLMAWGIKDIDDNEVVYTSDSDMLNFQLPPYDDSFDFTVWGYDLTPNNQYPVCYVGAKKKTWNQYFAVGDNGYQEALDYHLGGIECDNMRGNYWCYEQELIFNTLQNANCKLIPRSNGQNQFALNRVDRTDLHYKDRLNPDTLVDAHLWRPGYTDENFPKILELMQIMYPNEGFQWLIDYTNAYKQLL
jgi:hypothetical protein